MTQYITHSQEAWRGNSSLLCCHCTSLIICRDPVNPTHWPQAGSGLRGFSLSCWHCVIAHGFICIWHVLKLGWSQVWAPGWTIWMLCSLQSLETCWKCDARCVTSSLGDAKKHRCGLLLSGFWTYNPNSWPSHRRLQLRADCASEVITRSETWTVKWKKSPQNLTFWQDS